MLHPRVKSLIEQTHSSRTLSPSPPLFGVLAPVTTIPKRGGLRPIHTRCKVEQYDVILSNVPMVYFEQQVSSFALSGTAHSTPTSSRSTPPRQETSICCSRHNGFDISRADASRSRTIASVRGPQPFAGVKFT